MTQPLLLQVDEASAKGGGGGGRIRRRARGGRGGVYIFGSACSMGNRFITDDQYVTTKLNVMVSIL